MSWQNVVTPLVRYAINDVDAPQRYVDTRIQQAWLIGANYVSQEFTLPNNYIVDIVNTGIIPDPTMAGSQPGQYADPWMINLSALRAAIFMIGNDLRLAANSAWAVKDVHMSIDMKENYKAQKMLLDEAKESYDNIRMQYMVGVQPQLAAVLTPINILAGGYRAPLYGFDTRDRMLF